MRTKKNSLSHRKIKKLVLLVRMASTWFMKGFFKFSSYHKSLDSILYSRRLNKIELREEFLTQRALNC